MVGQSYLPYKHKQLNSRRIRQHSIARISSFTRWISTNLRLLLRTNWETLCFEGSFDPTNILNHRFTFDNCRTLEASRKSNTVSQISGKIQISRPSVTSTGFERRASIIRMCSNISSSSNISRHFSRYAPSAKILTKHSMELRSCFSWNSVFLAKLLCANRHALYNCCTGTSVVISIFVASSTMLVRWAMKEKWTRNYSRSGIHITYLKIAAQTTNEHTMGYGPDPCTSSEHPPPPRVPSYSTVQYTVL